jgi:hypothetical protein
MNTATAIEQTCLRCSYVVSSATAAEFGPAGDTYPTECRLCGGELVPAGGGAGD